MARTSENPKLRIVDESGRWQEVGEMLETVTVQQEDGRWIKVKSGGIEGWVAKTDVVLAEDAVRFFYCTDSGQPQQSVAL